MVARVLVATRSAGKMRELLPLLSGAGVLADSLLSIGLPEELDEDGLEVHETFEANALAKARWFSERTGGRIVVADDSGLEVEALDGLPGVLSKRWGGFHELSGAELDAANNAFLLASLVESARVGRSSRSARYVCAAACVWPHGALVSRGTTAGRIQSAPDGSHGFGYDPLFCSDELGVTFAMSGPEEKERVSHRGRAFRALLTMIRETEELREKLF